MGGAPLRPPRERGNACGNWGEETREKTREKILRLVAENPAISMEDMATSLGITRKGVEWQVSKLRGEGVLRRVGWKVG